MEGCRSWVTLPEPQLSLQERNWLLGVRQQLVIELDLRQLQPLPGLSLTVQLEPMRPRAVRLAEPLPAVASVSGRAQPPRLRWSLQPGALNRLQLSCWRVSLAAAAPSMAWVTTSSGLVAISTTPCSSIHP
jgi:hypothetical protein